MFWILNLEDLVIKKKMKINYVLFVYVVLKVEGKNVKLNVCMLFIENVYGDGVKRMNNAQYVDNQSKIIMNMNRDILMKIKKKKNKLLFKKQKIKIKKKKLK